MKKNRSHNIRQNLELRAKILAAIRSYFENKGYLEVETPILQQIYLWQKRRGFSESPSTPAQEVSFINYGVNSYEKSAYVFSYVAVSVSKFSSTCLVVYLSECQTAEIEFLVLNLYVDLIL